MPIHGVGEVGDRLYVDMRLVRGRSLASAVAHGPLDPERARQVVDQLHTVFAALRL